MLYNEIQYQVKLDSHKTIDFKVQLAPLLLFLLLLSLLLFKFSFKANSKVLALGVGQPDVGRSDSDRTRWPQALLSMLHIRTRTQAHTLICYYLARRECLCVCVCECAKTINIKCTRHTHKQAEHMRVCVCVNVEANLRLINFNVSPRTPFCWICCCFICVPFLQPLLLCFSLTPPSLPLLVLSSAFSLPLDALICLP